MIFASVSGDFAYDTKGCHETIAKSGARAIIPTCKCQAMEGTASLSRNLQPATHNVILAATRQLAKKSERSEAPITGAALSSPRYDATTTW